MNKRILTDEEMLSIKGGEVISLTVVMAILATAIVAVVVYKLFMSHGKGEVSMPGGFKFTWND